ncbi:Lrp/AsnC family transcriptional regulator [Candidatus Woesearchaeota archaeon]|nr:Lrp/AsnC family transcriptional regulator [Candidatus Woesearchaeota archaeon]
MHTRLSRKDLLLLSHLRKDGRQSLTALSKRTDVPISTIYDRLKAFGTGLVRRHVALLDFASMGYNTVATVCVKVGKGDRDGVREFLTRSERTNTVLKINNGFDFMFEGVFVHLRDLEDFLELMEERFTIKAKQVYYAIEELKREAFMADPETLDLVAGQALG